MLREQVGNRERQVVADEVVARVADEDAGEHAAAQAPVLRIHAVGRQGRDERGRLQETDHRTGVGGGTAIPFAWSTARSRSGRSVINPSIPNARARLHVLRIVDGPRDDGEAERVGLGDDARR